MVFHWSLSDNKFPLVSRTLLSFLADLNNAVIWMVSTRPLVSKSSSPCINPLVNVPSVTYWPSTEPSINRWTCVNKQRNSGNRCILSKISEYHLDLWTWLNSVQMRTPTGSRWVSENYVTRYHRRLESVRGEFELQLQLEIGCRSENLLQTEVLCPQWPTVEQLNRMRKKCCYGQEKFRSICRRLSPSPTPLSHITNINPFATFSRIKCERYIFL